MEVQDAPPPYRTVVFDCDSTLASIEGIDAVAAGHDEEFAALTRAAMAGELPLEAVYGRRLAIARPDRAAIERIGELYVRHRLPNTEGLIGALRHLGKRVVIVSGGIRTAVARLASFFELPERDVRAVDLRWDASGRYEGFDEGSPLARAGGKLEVLGRLAAETAGAIALVGDGATDLEAAPAADRFIAFGGVERRESVFRHAKITCEAADFAALLPLLCSPEEIDTVRRAAAFADLVRASERYA